MGWKKIQLGGSCFRRQEVPSGDRRAGTWTSQRDARNARFPDWLVYFFFSSFAAVREFIKKLIASERLLLPALEAKKMAAPSNGG